MDAPEHRLQELLSRVLDDTCSDDERQEFQDLLRKSPQFALGLLDEIFVHNLLHWQSEDITECLDLELAANEGQLNLAHGAAPDEAAVSRRSWVWALAACLALVAAWAVWLGISGGRGRQVALGRDGAAVAEIVDEQGVFWSNASNALRDGKFIYPGKLETNAGAYTLKFRTGPTMNVAGGSAILIESDMLVRLDRGQATAHVPESGVGFTIRTPVANVIDQGTQFGVAVRDHGGTDVVVFEGKVDLEDTIGASGGTKHLVRGEGVSITPQGDIGRLMQVQRDSKWGWWTANHPNPAANVINEVSDNVPPSDGSKYYCYQITSRGLQDDAAAYPDHPHQWNGLTAKGLPPFLRGADYVKTFNDYRYINDFEMTVKFSRPADLYVFFDDRVPVPEWLESKFEDTGVDIGLDEGPWPAGDKARRPDLPDKDNGVGGGESIDNAFSVWHRRCADAAPVRLGPVGVTHEARAMYGIAATPLE